MEEAEYCDRLGLIYRGELIVVGTPVELKTQFMTEKIIEVRCEHPQDAMAYLETIPGVKEVALFGKGLHVVVDNAEVVIPLLEKTFIEKQFTGVHIEQIVPSLEDVFVSLIEAKDRQEQPQKEFQG